MARKMKKQISPAVQIPRYRVIFTAVITVLSLFAVFAARMHIEQLSGKSLEVFAHTNGLAADWFLSCKETLYVLIACAVCLYAAGERVFPDAPCKVNPLFSRRALVPALLAGFYLLMSVLSAVFSQNREVVLRGNCTEFEGLAAVFAYCVLFCFGYNYAGSGKILRRALIALAAVSAVLAVGEYVTVPIIELPFMKYLIAPAQYRDAAAALHSSNTFREAALMFYNSNYAGAFFVLVFPAAFYALAVSRRLLCRIGAAFLTALLLLASVMTNATAAFYVILAELLLLSVWLLIRRAMPLGNLLILAAVLVLSGTAADFCTGHDFSANLLKSAVNSGTYTAPETIYRLSHLTLGSKTLHVQGESGGYLISPPFESGETLTVLPDAGTDCQMTGNHTDHITVQDTASGAVFFLDLIEGVLYLDAGYKSTIDFAVTTEGLRLIGQNGSLIGTVEESPFADSTWNRYYGVLTGRGYIWLNTLPVLKRCLFTGRGAGNFPFYFPQTDVVGLSNTNGTYHLVIDKPHNWYLQIAVTSGIPALLAVLALFGIWVLRGLRLIAHTDRSQLAADPGKLFFVCMFAGLCGFMVCGLVNDSSVTVNPVFWLCFGAMYARTAAHQKDGDAA